MERRGRDQVAFVLMGLAFATLGACAGKSESGKTDLDGSGSSAGGSAGSGLGGTVEGGASGSSAASPPTGGASGSSTGGGTTGGEATGGEATGGASGSSAAGTSGAGGATTCEDAPFGMLCVRGTPAGENERIDVGDPLRIDVRTSGCYSSSCTEVVVETCSISGVGSDFTASAEFCLASTADPSIGCTADCGGGGYAVCESNERLEAGDYTVTVGDLSVSFTVPGTLNVSAACDGSGF